MRRLVTAAVMFVLVIVCLCAAAVINSGREDPTGEYAVRLNEIEQLIGQGESEQAAALAADLRHEMRAAENSATDHTVPLMCGVCVLFVAVTSAYCWIVVIKPFHKLTDFAERVALGDLDTPLEYDRVNWFGKFTWAFDSMRREIQRARSCEKEAIENNKTVIASLSHDIKTPVASIRAYAEALELGMDADPEKRGRYISVMIRKCDEVSKLTEDMLTHSLSDLDKLKMSPEVFELNSFLSKTLDDISADDGMVRFEKTSYHLDVYADRGRTAQIAENLVNNAAKYAKTPVDVTVTREERMAVMRFRDYGGGIPDEDMPFVLNKFYRGKNSADEKGAGLGLFIVRYIAEQSGGSVSLKNCDKGLEVTVRLPVADDT